MRLNYISMTNRDGVKFMCIKFRERCRALLDYTRIVYRNNLFGVIKILKLKYILQTIENRSAVSYQAEAF